MGNTTWNNNSIVATDKSTITNWYASAIIGTRGIKCHMTSKLLQKTLKILSLELAMRGNNWKNNTIVATDEHHWRLYKVASFCYFQLLVVAEGTLQSASRTCGHVIVWKFSTMIFSLHMQTSEITLPVVSCLVVLSFIYDLLPFRYST